MEHGSRLDDWLAAARSELAGCSAPDLLAEQQLLARVREMRALQSVAAARIGTLPRRSHRTGFGVDHSAGARRRSPVRRRSPSR